MKPRLRKFGLTAHVTCSVGWLGADAGFLTLAMIGLLSQEAQMVRAAYLAMDSIGWFVIVPFSIAALFTGLVLALGTQWGLFRHYWVLLKFLLTVGATLVLLAHTRAMSAAALRVSGVPEDDLSRLTAQLAASDAGGHLGELQLQLVVAAGGGLLVLLAATVLGVFKPRGLTPWGRRKQRERVAAARRRSPRSPYRTDQ